MLKKAPDVKSGLKVGDRILSINGNTIASGTVKSVFDSETRGTGSITVEIIRKC